MGGLAAAPTAAPPPTPLPPAPTPAPLDAMFMQQMQFLVAELARKDLAASAEREAMRAERESMRAERESMRAEKKTAASAERERAALAASAERERAALAASAERAVAALDREAVWEAKTMALQHKLDLSEGAVRARSLYNVCIRDIAKRVADKSKAQQTRTASGVESMLMNGSSCPALRDYNGAVASANGLDPAEVQLHALHAVQGVAQIAIQAARLLQVTPAG